MPFIVECLNPFEPFKDSRKTEVPTGTVIRSWLGERFPGFVEFEKPTVCFYNGQPLLRKDWTQELSENDVVVFVTQPGGPLLPYIIYAIISIVVGVAIALLMPKPKYDSTQGESVYSIRGQQNRVRLGDAVEAGYGRCRLWPSYGALPYNRYIGNDQWQFALLCLGQGEWDVDSVQIEDTDISNFQEVQYAIYEPGQPVTLFDDRVNTSSEVSNVELFAPNESGYVQWTGPFVANESGTTTTKLEVDVIMPLGLNHMTDKGKMRTGVMSLVVEYRQIDDAGAPTGSWTNFASPTWALATATAQRYTLEKTVSAGRYEVRVSRTSNKDTANSSASMVLWGQLRSVLPSVRVYAGKTMLALKMRATNNLNDQSAYRVNVWATRKLPIWNASTGWSAPTATRSIVWAICDISRASYGGQLPEAYLPLSDLLAMDTAYTAEGRYFDYIFDQKITVWEALRIAARVGRAVPMIEGSQITLIKDVPRTLPTVLFNQNNIQENSFKWNIMLPRDGDYDGVLMEYTDPNDFLPRQIKCLASGDAGDNLEDVKLLGCTDRTWAYREGMYYRESKRRLRQGVSFQTGLEGHLPRYGALIGVSHDLPRWGAGGWVLAAAGRTLQLSDPVTFTTGSHYIGIRMKDGSSSAPLLCTAGVDAFHVVLAADAPAGLYFNDKTEPPAYLFGQGLTNWSRNLVVSNITPDSESDVTIEAFIYDSEIFAHDAEAAPDDPTVVPPVDPTPTVPEINCASVSVRWAPGSNTHAIATWAAVVGATSYEVWVSVDAGVTWAPVGYTDTTSLQFPCTIGDIVARVRPIGAGIGAWCETIASMASEADPWDLGTDTYADDIPLDTLYPPSAVLTVTCKQRGGPAEKIGYPEIVVTADPQKYLAGSVSGTGTAYGYVTSDCSGAITGSEVWEFTGSNTIDPVTGVETRGVTLTITPSSTGIPTVYPDQPIGSCGSSDCIHTVTKTPTTCTLTADNTCCPSGNSGRTRHVDLFVTTLSNPDTCANAVARLVATLDAWGDVTATGGHAATAEHGSCALSVVYVEALLIVDGSGWLGDWEYVIRVTWGRRASGSSDPFVEFQVTDYAIPADESAMFHEEIEYPNTEGWETACLSVEITS